MNSLKLTKNVNQQKIFVVNEIYNWNIKYWSEKNSRDRKPSLKAIMHLETINCDH